MFTHSYKRRAHHHDYYAPYIYHITIMKAAMVPAFGQIAGDCRIAPGAAGCAYIEPSALGRIIITEIKAMPRYHPIVQLYQYIVMPDHVHILLRITERSPKALGYYIGNFTGGVRRAWRNSTGLDYPIFEKGYNDRIIGPKRSLDTVFRYIRTNPHRLAVRKFYPDFFRKVYNVTIGGTKCQTYGNQFLMRNPFKEQVVIHRSDNEQTRANNRDLWLYTAANGGVLVSPFISPGEKEIRKEAEQIGGKIILISNQFMDERYKPFSHDFELCCEGRLLIVSIGTETISKLSRQSCLAMNTIAATLVNNCGS